MIHEEREALQAIFNIVYKGLQSQGFERSRDKFGVCLYRGAHNLKCGIGYLIPDECYDLDMENKPVHALMKNYGKLEEIFGDNTANIRKVAVNDLNELQSCHDRGTNPELMKANLEAFAKTWMIVIPK